MECIALSKALDYQQTDILSQVFFSQIGSRTLLFTDLFYFWELTFETK